MKKIFTILFAGLVLAGCTNNKNQEKTILEDILKVHDKVMEADEPLMKNKMQLDSLLKQTDLPGQDTAAILSKKLGSAESAMDDWMHGFDPEHKGKTTDETLDYMNKQKEQIMAIDTQINSAVNASNQYLLKFKKK
jgi:hypothetical protein